MLRSEGSWGQVEGHAKIGKYSFKARCSHLEEMLSILEKVSWWDLGHQAEIEEGGTGKGREAASEIVKSCFQGLLFLFISPIRGWSVEISSIMLPGGSQRREEYTPKCSACFLRGQRRERKLTPAQTEPKAVLLCPLTPVSSHWPSATTWGPQI